MLQNTRNGSNSSALGSVRASRSGRGCLGRPIFEGGDFGGAGFVATSLKIGPWACSTWIAWAGALLPPLAQKKSIPRTGRLTHRRSAPAMQNTITRAIAVELFLAAPRRAGWATNSSPRDIADAGISTMGG